MSTPYKTILLDPPWAERGGGKIRRGADRHYPLIDSMESMADVIKGSGRWHPDPDAGCHVWMWVTTSWLFKGAPQLADLLGLRYIRHYVWVKTIPNRRNLIACLPQRGLLGSDTVCQLDHDVSGDGSPRLAMGLGQYGRGSDELLLLYQANKNTLKPLPSAKSTRSVIHAPLGRHSEKPDQSYSLIEAVSPGPRIEFFCRNPRKGWDAWGNDPSLG